LSMGLQILCTENRNKRQSFEHLRAAAGILNP
jgi:hypothetical protein